MTDPAHPETPDEALDRLVRNSRRVTDAEIRELRRLEDAEAGTDPAPDPGDERAKCGLRACPYRVPHLGICSGCNYEPVQP